MTPFRPQLAPSVAPLVRDPQSKVQKMPPMHLMLTAERLRQSTHTFDQEEFKDVFRRRTRSNASSEGSLPTTTEDGTHMGTSDSVSSVSSGSSGTSTCRQAKAPTPPPPAIPKRRTRETRVKAAVKEQILTVRLPPPKFTQTHLHGRAQPSAASRTGSCSPSPATPDVDYTLIPEELETHILFGWKKRNILDYFGYPDDIGVTEVESRLKHYGPGTFASLFLFTEFETNCFQDSTLLPELRALLARIPQGDEGTK